MRPTSTPRPRGLLSDPSFKNLLKQQYNMFSLRPTSTPRPRGFLCDPCGKNHLSCFSICSLRSLGVEDPPRRTVKFFVIVCLYFVCRRFAAENSHRLRRDLHDFSVVSVNLLWIALKSLINN